MARFYKRGSSGTMSETTGEDASFSAVLLSAEEYSGLKNLIQEAEYREDKLWNRLNYARQNFDRELNEQKKKAEADIQAKQAIVNKQEKIIDKMTEELSQAKQTIVNEQKKIIDKMTEELSQAKAEAEKVSGLNKNLLRIMTERANQARGVHPKKQHEGYLVLECRQWTEKYVEEVWDHQDHKRQYDNEEGRPLAKRKRYLMLDHKAADVWKSVIQTPFDASIPLEYIREEARKPLFHLVQTLGITHTSSVMGKYFPFDNGNQEEKLNTMYRIRFNANYREGFWEVEIFTTRALVVPEEMRPPRKAGKKRGESA